MRTFLQGASASRFQLRYLIPRWADDTSFDPTTCAMLHHQVGCCICFGRQNRYFREPTMPCVSQIMHLVVNPLYRHRDIFIDVSQMISYPIFCYRSHGCLTLKKDQIKIPRQNPQIRGPIYYSLSKSLCGTCLVWFEGKLQTSRHQLLSVSWCLGVEISSHESKRPHIVVGPGSAHRLSQAEIMKIWEQKVPREQPEKQGYRQDDQPALHY